MQNPELLAAFQSSLLLVLHEGGTAAEMRARIQPSADACGLGDYVRSFEHRMLTVASDLVRKWGRKDAASEDERGRG